MEASNVLRQAKEPDRRSIYVKSELGWILIEGDEHAIEVVDFQDENPPHHLRHDSNAADDDSIVAQCARQIQQYLHGERLSFDIPLRPAGTEFQQTVWSELQSISCGETRSYGDIARSIGNPKGVRAVGGAIGRNPISILVPCHRVIGSDGSLTGYAGELWRKTWLLEHERKLHLHHHMQS
jgi:methylated-DNA-[protein]-cysteine S-methyltransferase